MKNKVLIIDDEHSFRDLYTQTLSDLNISILTASSGEEALSIIEKQDLNLVISDIKMGNMDGITLLNKVKKVNPELPFLLVTAYANIKDAVSSLKLGAIDYLEKPIDLNELKESVCDILSLNTKKDSIPEISKKILKGIIAESTIMKKLFYDAYRVANSDVTVLITGESGTGKEVIANFIHNNSPRKSKDLVTVNCAAISPTLLNSELFGHIKGAFSGAVSDRTGKFRKADEGTFFLDEIGDMPLELQASLLRTLENRTVNPVGSDKDLKIDVRLIAATNKNLEEEIKAGNFREDLYYRLNVITIEIPPLRNRREDILPTAKYFLNINGTSHKKLSANVSRVLQQYEWPGNIRELANAMKRARILSGTNLIMPEHLPQNILSKPPSIKNIDKVSTLEDKEILAIKNALIETKGNRTKAAKILGISRRTIINKINKYGNELE